MCVASFSTFAYDSQVDHTYLNILFWSDAIRSEPHYRHTVLPCTQAEGWGVGPLMAQVAHATSAVSIC